jgi:serine/threonine protein kinase
LNQIEEVARMETDPRVSELLRWQELRQQGQIITAAQLCVDCPELAGELERRMEKVDHWEQFLGATIDAEDAPNTPPAFFGKYRVVRPLGEGGQASTLLAWDPDLHCHVVLKLYHNNWNAAEQDNVLSEGRALARVRSPYVARCYGVEHQGDVPALVVEYVPGRSLRQEQRARPLDHRQALELTGQLAEGLAAVHVCGLLHRDLKPDNVLVGDDGRPRLVDFGLAAALASADLANVSGTLSYMAPEQARGEAERIDARTDVYGLGAVLYELLTGRPPHRGTSREELWRAACAGDVVPTRQLNRRVPRAVNELCLRCLAKDPSQRFSSAADLAGAVRRLQRQRRWRLPLAATAATLVLLGLASIPLAKSWLPPTVPGPAPPGPSARPPAVAPLTAKVDVRIWKKADTSKGLTLGDAGALPLRAGDWMRVEAQSDRPAYLYVLYLDARGEASPLFPWRRYDWGNRPAEEKRTQLRLPEDPLKDAARLEDGPSGIEAVLLLARDEPLGDVEVDRLRGLFQNKPPAAKFDPLRGAVWLGKDMHFGDDRDRARPNYDKAGTVADPVERVRSLVGNELKGLAEDARGVCYPFAGR